MKTSDFKYLRFGFEEFNIAQSKVIPSVEKDCNLIISFPPATGKSAIAEACFAYSISKGQKVIYVCPFKALANQKRGEWVKLFGTDVSLISGDSSTEIEDCSESKIIIFTAESLDLALRNIKNEPFFKSVSCICFDEVHLIGDETRGRAYECGIIRMAEVNPSCRFVLLSGTLSNAKELAKWIKVLTKKETMLFSTGWRPVDFKIRYHYVEKYAEIKKLKELLKEYRGSKTIVFVHSKIMGKKICDELKKSKIRHVYHNANLSQGKREKVEELFKSKYSDVDVIIATSTLSAGVNLI